MSTASPVHSRLLGLADNPTYVGRTLTYDRGEYRQARGPLEALTVEGEVLKLRTSWLEYTDEDGHRVLWAKDPLTFWLSEQSTLAEIKNDGSVVLTSATNFRAVIDRTDAPRLTPPPARP